MEQSLNWFKALNKQRQLSLVGGFIFSTFMIVFLVIWAVSPSYGVLFNHLDSQDANQILTQLEQEKIPYQIRHQGSEILIDKPLIEKTRIKLMGSGLQFTHNVGFELFDKTDFGMTEFSQKINYQRALQGELERTISSIDEIKHARIHLVIPENHLFQESDNAPRAAVTLHLNRSLSGQQVTSIQQLITASVAHLPATNVIIVDQHGNRLITNEDDAPSIHFSAKKSIERYLNEKVMHMLHRIFTHERVVVKIDATLNYDELQRELIKPQHNGLISHEKVIKHSSTDKAGKKPVNHDLTREKKYEFGHEKEHFIRANGTIERLTVSVVLPLETSQEKIIQVTRLVKSVVGFNAQRGDTISVEALIAESKTTPRSAMTPSRHDASFPKAFVSSGIGLLIVMLIVLALRFRSRVKQRQILLTQLTQWLNEHD